MHVANPLRSDDSWTHVSLIGALSFAFTLIQLRSFREDEHLALRARLVASFPGTTRPTQDPPLPSGLRFCSGQYHGTVHATSQSRRQCIAEPL